MVHEYYVIFQQLILTMMQIHPMNDVFKLNRMNNVLQFITVTPMINLLHIILCDVTICLGDIVLVKISYANLGEPLDYQDTKTYGFDENHSITTIYNETTIFGINYGIQYDNSNTSYQLLLTNNHHQLAYSNQTIITITAISVSYNPTYNRCSWQYIMMQLQPFQQPFQQQSQQPLR